MTKFLEHTFANLGLQLLFGVGIISLLGFVIWRLNRTFFKLLGYKKGRGTFLSTGAIGVPIHEFGHAFFCVLFFHKIKEVKWFQWNTTDGTLGYVRHTFNKKNIYQQIGNFFIGIGPLVFGSAVIVGLIYILLPNSGDMSFMGGTSISKYWSTVWHVFLVIFDYHNFAFVSWWIFIVLACSIAMHMDLSMADIKGMLRGLLYIIVVMLVMNMALVLIKLKWARAVTNAFLWMSISVVSFMAISVLLLSMLVLIAAFFRFIQRRIRMRRAKKGRLPAKGAKITTPVIQPSDAEA